MSRKDCIPTSLLPVPGEDSKSIEVDIGFLQTQEVANRAASEFQDIRTATAAVTVRVHGEEADHFCCFPPESMSAALAQTRSASTSLMPLTIAKRRSFLRAASRRAAVSAKNDGASGR